VAGAADGLIRAAIRAGAWRHCRAAGKRVKVAASQTLLLFFLQQGGFANEKVHGPVHGQCRRL